MRKILFILGCFLFLFSLHNVKTYAATNKSTSVVRKTYNTTKVSNSIVTYAKSLIGTPYRFGGTSPRRGFDCSGFVYHVYNKVGLHYGRNTASDWWNTYNRIKLPKTGDVIVFKNTYKPGPSHVGIYLGGSKFIHADSSRGVKIDSLSLPYYRNHFLGYVSI